MQTVEKPNSNLRKWAGILAVAAVVAVLVAVFASRFGIDVTYVESPLIGVPAPSLEFEFLDGPGTLETDDLHGNVVVMNFWASWCIPCRSEHPVLIDTAARYADGDVRFVGVLHEDEPESGAAFLDSLGWSEHTDYVLGDGSGAAIEYGIYGIPETFVIDANGVIAAKVTGGVTVASLSAAIETARQASS